MSDARDIPGARILPATRFKEAFCLMKYRAEDGTVEWLWNSRDGISPFTVLKPDLLRVGADLDRRQQMMTHVDWHEDAFVPNFVPPIGSRIFSDMPRFDPDRHQFNLRVETVGEMLHRQFREKAEKEPWRPSPRAA